MPKSTPRSKHIAAKHWFFREHVGRTTRIAKVDTKKQKADMFTKALPEKDFKNVRHLLCGWQQRELFTREEVLNSALVRAHRRAVDRKSDFTVAIIYRMRLRLLTTSTQQLLFGACRAVLLDNTH